MRKNLRNLKNIFLLLTIMTAMCIFVGCGGGKQDDSAMLPEKSDRSTEQSADTGDDEEQINGEKQESDAKDGREDTQDQPDGNPVDTPVNEKSDASPDESAELCVDVESIGDNSVVGNKITIEPGLDGDTSVIMIGNGEDKDLISIYFEEDASYVYEIIRNGGADVETREGSFSDIEVGLILDLTGYYKGDDFYANEVRISKVILN